jgi:hypothetical protein
MLYKSADFWKKVERTTGVLGGMSTFLFAESEVPYWWMQISGGLTIVGMLLAVWMADTDGNGIVDLFDKNKQKEK